MMRRFGLPVVLFASCLFTTLASGARFMDNFHRGLPPVVTDGDLWPWPWLWQHWERLFSGIPFSATLLGILLAHEFGHYFACRRHKIRATLPLLLPAPTLSGSMGAIIRIESRIPDRRALLHVGISGPLAGFLCAAVAIVTGFFASNPAADVSGIVRFGGQPLLLQLAHAFVCACHGPLPAFEQLTPHPVLLAGWIGLFITSLNLIPAGQLDGGHIVFALSPALHRRLTQFLPFVLIVVGLFCWIGWILWGCFLLLPMLRHPQVRRNDPLRRADLLLVVIGMLIFALSFTLVPFSDNSLVHFFRTSF